MDDPLAGKTEGWPAARPETIAYLAEKRIRCVGTDSPTLGGVDPQRSLATYWLLGCQGMVGVEFLTNLRARRAGVFSLRRAAHQGLARLSGTCDRDLLLKARARDVRAAVASQHAMIVSRRCCSSSAPPLLERVDNARDAQFLVLGAPKLRNPGMPADKVAKLALVDLVNSPKLDELGAR